VTATQDPLALTPVAPQRDEARIARREQIRLVLRSKTFIAGALIVGFWVFCAAFGTTTGSERTTWGATCSHASSPARATS
jgi:hypothetical protein